MSTRRNLGSAWNAAGNSYTSIPCVLDPRALVPNQVFGATAPATAALDGTPTSVTTTVASRSVGIGFTVPASQAVSIGFRNSTARNVALTGSSTITGGTCGYTSVYFYFYLYDHTGTRLKSGSLSCGSSGSLYTTSALPAGSYTVLIVPTGLVYGTLGRPQPAERRPAPRPSTSPPRTVA